MSQIDRALRQHLDSFLEEQRRLHKEVTDAVVDARVAGAQAKEAAETINKSLIPLNNWMASLDKRIAKIENWQAGVIGGGIVAGAMLWDKAKKMLGLS